MEEENRDLNEQKRQFHEFFETQVSDIIDPMI
jgi:hypothetical protein